MPSRKRGRCPSCNIRSSDRKKREDGSDTLAKQPRHEFDVHSDDSTEASCDAHDNLRLGQGCRGIKGDEEAVDVEGGQRGWSIDP